MKNSLFQVEQWLDDILDRRLHIWHCLALDLLTVILLFSMDWWKGDLHPLLVWIIAILPMGLGLQLQNRVHVRKKKEPTTISLALIITTTTLLLMTVVGVVATAQNKGQTILFLVLVTAGITAVILPLLFVSQLPNRRRIGRDHTVPKDKLFQ